MSSRPEQRQHWLKLFCSMKNNRPTIGLALSGGSGRAITHIGVLEVFREKNIPIDIITATSSGAVIAAAYASGTMEQLKQDWLRLDQRFIIEMLSLETTGGGILSMDKFGEWMEKYTRGLKLEEVKPTLGMVCVDLNTGESITLSMGDIVWAVQASCTVPGLFEPIHWGNRLLVDGGLYSIVPTTEAKVLGADLVIAVDIASSRYMFPRKFHHFRKGYRFLRNSWPAQIYAKLHSWTDTFFRKSIDLIYYNQSDVFEESVAQQAGTFKNLGRALDIAETQQEKKADLLTDCDYLISPNVKHLSKVDMNSSQIMLDEGRKVALAAILDIEKVMRDYNWRKQNGVFQKIMKRQRIKHE